MTVVSTLALFEKGTSVLSTLALFEKRIYNSAFNFSLVPLRAELNGATERILQRGVSAVGTLRDVQPAPSDWSKRV